MRYLKIWFIYMQVVIHKYIYVYRPVMIVCASGLSCSSQHTLYFLRLLKHLARGERCDAAYGGIGIHVETDEQRKKSWSYGNAARSFEEFYARYKGLTDALLDNPKIFGFCYTQLTDVEQEKNGLFTYDGRVPKFDLEIISAINKRKAACEE